VASSAVGGRLTADRAQKTVALTTPTDHGMKPLMSLLASLKDVVVGRAVRLMSDPRLTKMASSPRVMNAAMKALSVGGNVKTELTKATKLAAGVFGIATEDEVATLRTTIQNLEDTVATLEARTTTRASGHIDLFSASSSSVE
jgi:hypothetical protein